MDKRISELDLVTTLTSNDVLPIVNGGVTKKVRVAQLGTDLTYTESTSNGVVVSSTGTDATIPLASGSNAGLLSPTEKAKLIDLSGVNTGDQDLSGLVVKNAPITGATKTKITFDSKGLVTSGTDATTSDIADSTDKRYVTDAQLTLLSNTSGTNSGDNAVNSLYSGLDSTKENKSLSAYTMRVNNTNATANSSEVGFRISSEGDIGAVAWTGTTAPTGGNQKYRWQRVGNLVTAQFTALYSVAGASVTQARFQLPDDMPTPIRPTGFSESSNIKYYTGYGHITNSLTLFSTVTTNVYMVGNVTDNSKYDIVIVGSSASHIGFYATIQYFTS